jgi:hypothetical protein
MGMGMGLAMMPLFSGAMQTLRKAAVARASTTLNILQQVAASIGTAVMTVILTSALGNGGVPNPSSGSAFGHTYIYATAFVAVAFIAAWFLPRRKPEPIEEPGEDAEAAPVLIHA